MSNPDPDDVNIYKVIQILPILPELHPSGKITPPSPVKQPRYGLGLRRTVFKSLHSISEGLLGVLEDGTTGILEGLLGALESDAGVKT